MLFNSHSFLFVYLPIVFCGFFLLAKGGKKLAASWLTIASFFFYGYWAPQYIVLLLVSITFNFHTAKAIVRCDPRAAAGLRKRLFVAVLAINLGLLAYYKYANFFVGNLELLNPSWHLTIDVLLPLGISFFTFTQIAFLVDAYQGKSSEPSFVHYCLFVTYFPHLIAGPVLHHNEMMPQFRKPDTYRVNALNVSVGVAIFAIGLFKKVVVADSLAPYSNAVFDASSGGYTLTFLEAWAGALAYTFQLYFDFSGYSDMAIGLSRMFNVSLPLNFHSPYKATNIIDFWRRWHMTLSRFLRDYLYVPLGGNKHGRFRRYINLMLTMLLGGLWHGAGWTFVIWGGLHGLYLVINHAWRRFWERYGRENLLPASVSKLAGLALTFLAVVVGWVFFRSDNLNAAMSMFHGMLGLNGLILQDGWQARLGGLGDSALLIGASFGQLRVLDSVRILGWLVLLAVACMTLPNTQEIMVKYQPALDFGPPQKRSLLVWRPNSVWGAAMGALLAVGILLISRKSEFLYFQF